MNVRDGNDEGLRVDDGALQSVQLIQCTAKFISQILIQPLHDLISLLRVLEASLHILHCFTQEFILARNRVLFEYFLEKVVRLDIFLNFFEQTDQLFRRFRRLSEDWLLLLSFGFLVFSSDFIIFFELCEALDDG